MRLRVLVAAVVLALSAPGVAAYCESIVEVVRITLVSGPDTEDSGGEGVAWFEGGILFDTGGTVPVEHDAYLEGVVYGRLYLRREE